jgi:hypothetical protein
VLKGTIPTNFAGLLESVMVAFEEVITGALKPFPISSTKHLI